MTEVTAAMWSACSGQRALHWRWASAIGSKGSRSGTQLPYVTRDARAMREEPGLDADYHVILTSKY